MQLVDALLLANNSQAEFKAGPLYLVPAHGVTMHKIDFITAWDEAECLELSSKANRLDLTYAAGCFTVEALGDRLAINQNIGFNTDGTPRSNELKREQGDWDVGACQLKVGYLVGPHLMPDIEHAMEFALDPKLAIPYFCSLMAGKRLVAQKLIATSPSPEPRYNDPLMVATAIYNEGLTGFVRDWYKPGKWLPHCGRVQDFERWYADKLGLSPLYPIAK